MRLKYISNANSASSTRKSNNNDYKNDIKNKNNRNDNIKSDVVSPRKNKRPRDGLPQHMPSTQLIFPSSKVRVHSVACTALWPLLTTHAPRCRSRRRPPHLAAHPPALASPPPSTQPDSLHAPSPPPRTQSPSTISLPPCTQLHSLHALSIPLSPSPSTHPASLPPSRRPVLLEFSASYLRLSPPRYAVMIYASALNSLCIH